MPLFELKCLKCDQKIEVIQSYYDERPKLHEDCGGELQQLFSVPAKFIGPQTVGSIAEKNAKKMSSDAQDYALEMSRTRKNPRKDSKPFSSDTRNIEDKITARKESEKKRDFMMKLGNATKEQKKKYIETGQL